MIARCPQCSRPWSEASLDCHEHALHEAATVRVAGAANGSAVACGRPSRINARCGITHHLGCACHEARRDAELAEARAELARVTAERDALTRRIETMPPWRVSSPPTDDEMRALRLRWSTGPERYQADADKLIAAVIDLRTKFDALRAAVRESFAADTARDDAGETAYRTANAHNPGSDVREAAERAHSKAIARAIAARKALRALVEVKP